MQLIDTHFHLDYYKNHRYWYEKINELKQYTLCVTNSPGIYHSCKRLYKETKYIKFALGYNPQQSVEEPFQRELFLREIPKTSYIGEVGLDFSRKYIATSRTQIDAFEFICDIAAKENSLLSVHSRNAEAETLNRLKMSGVTRAIIHWYSGDVVTLSKLLDEGYYFSINANMCSTVKGRSIITRIPFNRLLIESDGPFSKVLGRRYMPSMLSDLYSVVGNAVGCENLEYIVWENFKALLTR